jgi:EAL domain-containing protein (putative c-di-GMP-specific phosphodiesterase class I)
LRNAAKRNEVSLVFQPQFCLRTGRLVGVESLMRWNHPELGPVSPGRFIPVAEECGLILELGELALRQSCRFGRAWFERGWLDARVAVNLSPAQFAYQDLTELVTQILEETGLPARCLELEITEGMLMRDRRGAAATLEALHRCGVTLALDDFGVGYSSLSYLKRFRLDKLKIDRSFVSQLPHDAGDAAIARTIIHLGKTLRLKVLAEGIETKEQRDFLTAAGCDEAQGYLLAKPMPAAELERLLPSALPVARAG